MFSTFRKPCCSAASAGARALRRAQVLGCAPATSPPLACRDLDEQKRLVVGRGAEALVLGGFTGSGRRRRCGCGGELDRAVDGDAAVVDG
jgi:hypothetical protein